MKSIEAMAKRLVNQTIEDLRCSLQFEQDLAVLKKALDLVESGQGGYGSGKTAAKIIRSRMNKLEKDTLHDHSPQ